MDKRTFTWEEAAGLLPAVRDLTAAAANELEAILGGADFDDAGGIPQAVIGDYQRIVARWTSAVTDLGAEVKGLWLVDFDSGSGYYCWRYPEPSLQFFHTYEEGFQGRVPLT
jgi:hypothetical protein